MTHSEFATLIANIGLDNAYDHFTDDTQHNPPFICFIYPDRADMVADNSNYQPIERVRVEFYSILRDFETEDTIGTALNNAGLVYLKGCEYLDDQQMYITTFDTSYILTEEQEDAESGE